MAKRVRIGLVQAIVASIVIHAAIVSPWFVYRLWADPDDPPTLVIDLQGLTADDQAEARVLEQVKGAPTTVDAPDKDKPKDDPLPDPVDPDKKANDAITVPAAPPEKQAVGKDKQDVVGTQQQQAARSVRAKQSEQDELSAYVKLLTKKIREKLPSSDSGRRASAIVSFTILTNGRIRPESLKIVQSTGQERLDASALRSIRASEPFVAPPQELTIGVILDFEPRG